MTLVVPYESTGQQLGETRQAMAKRLMKDLEEIIDMEPCKKRDDKYYVVFHAKPYPNHPGIIKMKRMVIFHKKPPMMLSCLCFGVDNQKNELTIEYALPGSWPVWSVGGTNEPVPEVLGSLNELSKITDLDKIIAF
jgi:hypothetical protein